MHDPLQKFISEARAKNLDDKQIADLLYAHNWPKQQVETALLGLQVPTAPEVTESNTTEFGRTISSLEAALQHILLWVFTATSTIMFGVVSATLFGGEDAPHDILTTYFVIEFFTFLPFAIMFAHYIREFRKHTDLKTGKIWSTITIVLHSIGLVTALITFTLAILLIDNHDDKTATAIGSAALILINAFVVAAYVTINYTKNFTDKLRNTFIVAFPFTLLIVTLVFGLYGLAQFAPIKQDQKTRKDLHKVTTMVREYTKKNKALPANLEVSGVKVATDISYEPVTLSRYKLCTDLVTDTTESYSYTDDDTIYDSYVDDSYFMGVKKGHQCFVVQAEVLEERQY